MKGEKLHDKGAQPVQMNMLTHRSVHDDISWANASLVATVSEDSTLVLQQRVEDAGFLNIVVTLMRGDKVFILCVEQENILKVINDAIDFFGMLFTNLHKWSLKDVRYEQG